VEEWEITVKASDIALAETTDRGEN
jgi:hypothetical protein